MKTIIFYAAIFLLATAGSIGAADIESSQFIDHMRSLGSPGAPELYEDSVIFTAPSSHRRVGIAFAHEDFGKVHWLQQFLVPQDPLGAPIPRGKKVPDPYIDSGLRFLLYPIPENSPELEYRMVIDGLWTTDPANPASRKDSRSGLTYSVLSLPVKPPAPGPAGSPRGHLSFSFRGPPGETVTVAGSFNNWDPFMYELAESPAGTYSITIPLPPGIYQYVFFHRGERYLDPYNFRRAYTKEGRTVSEAVIE
ncbi:hypothetical protein FACS1894163_12410 [Spirochaetia bacterium]|nr:hypothetical protein FACS1894163_12410 [Spirochaetia bacterium]